MIRTKEKTYGIRELANWLLNYAEERGIAVTNMSLNKLIYFAYEHALLHHGRKLTNAKIEAWEHGPVFREVYRSFSEYGSKPILTRASKYNPTTDKVEEVLPTLDEEDAAIVEEAISPLIGFSAAVLREISHESDGPWATTWYHEDTTNPGMQITDEIISQYGVRKDTVQ